MEHIKEDVEQGKKKTRRRREFRLSDSDTKQISRIIRMIILLGAILLFHYLGVDWKLNGPVLFLLDYLTTIEPPSAS